MKLTGKTDIDAPIDFLYRTLNDHATWEAEARQRGVEVERPADMPLAGPGAGWRIRLPYRGKVRKILVRLDGLTPETRIDYTLEGQSMGGTLVVELSRLSPRRTRLRLSLDVKPKTLAARLMLNTLRLAKGRVSARLDQRLAQVGARLAEMHRQGRGVAGQA